MPPDVLEPIIRKIADEFVSEGVASEVATAGLNSIREICSRAPLAMNETLLQDLTEYKGSKDKGVMMGARSLIGLYREVAPEMLKRKDRGKVATMSAKDRDQLRFGEETPGTIEGLELLEEWKENERVKRLADGEEGAESEDDETAWKEWEVEEDDDSDDSSSWIGVSSDEEINISDSEDEKPAKKPKKKNGVGETELNSDNDGDKNENDEVDGIEKDIKAVALEEKRISTLATTKVSFPLHIMTILTSTDPYTRRLCKTCRVTRTSWSRENFG